MMNRKLDGAAIAHPDQRPAPQFLVTAEPEPAAARTSSRGTQSAESIRWTQSAEARRERIAIAAYYLAEARGFAPGHEVEDWLLAQAQVDAQDAAFFAC
jgi:hypothetical protein